MMVSFDSKHDVLYIKFSEDKIADTMEVDSGLLVDYGAGGQMVGIEIIGASNLMKANPLEEIVINHQ